MRLCSGRTGRRRDRRIAGLREAVGVGGKPQAMLLGQLGEGALVPPSSQRRQHLHATGVMHGTCVLGFTAGLTSAHGGRSHVMSW